MARRAAEPNDSATQAPDMPVRVRRPLGGCIVHSDRGRFAQSFPVNEQQRQLLLKWLYQDIFQNHQSRANLKTELTNAPSG